MIHRALSRLGMVLLAASLCLHAAGCRTNPVTGKSEMIFFSTANELAMGDEYHPNIIFMYDGEYQDPALKLYLGTIVNRLHAAGHRPDMRVDFTVLNTSMYNAFAIPGHVYATRGFLAELKNEAQFAAVMAHELTHVNALHTAKQMTHQVLMAAGFSVAGQALGNSGSAQAAMQVGQVSLALLGLSYSREQEHQADRVGTYYMALAGWDPRQAIEMQRLLASFGGEGTILDKYLSTHPQAPERIAEIRAVIQEKSLLESGYIQGDGVYEQRWNRHLADLRKVNEAFKSHDRGAQLLEKGNPTEALSAAEQAIHNRSDQAPFHRLKGDALLRLERPGDARSAYRKSLAVDARYVPANIGLGQVALQQDDMAEAEKEFGAAVRGFPASPLANFGLGVTRVRLSRFGDAIPPLEAAASAMPKQPVVLFLLGVCYDRTNQPVKAYVAYRNSVQAGLQGDQRTIAQQRLAELQPIVQSQSAQSQGAQGQQQSGDGL